MSEPTIKQGNGKPLGTQTALTNTRRGSVGFAYGWAVGIVFLAALFRLSLTPVLGPSAVPYIMFFPAVVLSAWLGGLGPGLLSVALSAIVASYLFVGPPHSFSLSGTTEVWSLVLFLCAGFCIAGIGETQHRARQHAEQGARDADERQALLLTTLHSIGDAVIVTDEAGCITLMNPLAERMTGWSESEAAGKPCDVIFKITNEATGAVVESPIDKVLKLGAVVGLANHTILTARDGTVYPIDDSGAPIRDRGGNLQGVVLVFRDITERRNQERVLEESEARFRAILDNAPSIIYVKNREGRYTLVNRAFELLNGRTYEETIGRTDRELFPSALCPPILANDQRVFETGEPLQLEESGPFGDRPRTYLTTMFPLRDGVGEIYALCGVSTDITRRKQDEIARQFLTEASTVLASSLDYEVTLQQVARLAVPEIADWCSVDMWMDDGTVRQLAVAHVDPEKVKWAHELRELYPSDVETGGLSNVLRTGQSEIYPDIPEEMLVAAARDERHLEIMRQIGFRSVIIVPIIARERVLGVITLVTTDESGLAYTQDDLTLAEGLASRAALAIDNTRLYQAAHKEIGERQRTEEALHASEERFRFALANSDISVYLADQDLRYTWAYAGRRNGELTEIYGKTDEDFLYAEDAARLTEIKRRVLATGVEERHITRATRLGQEARFYDTLFVPQRDTAGQIIGVTGTVTDVTERKKTQDALAQHQAEIEALNVRLQRSMRETHHRVKNNLQVITALIGMQQMQHPDSVPTTELARLTQHIQSLASIHDLLTLQARTDVEVSSISVRAMMEKLMSPLRNMVEERAITFEVEDLNLPVRQSTTMAVLVNELISNALKHGKGAVHVSFHVLSQTAILEVLDEGPGFPAGFNPTSAANTGLDLIGSLSQIDLGGSVRYENQGEGGAKVVIEFPLPSSISG